MIAAVVDDGNMMIDNDDGDDDDDSDADCGVIIHTQETVTASVLNAN